MGVQEKARREVREVREGRVGREHGEKKMRRCDEIGKGQQIETGRTKFNKVGSP